MSSVESQQKQDGTGLLAPVAVFICYLLLYRYSNFFHTTDLRATPWNPETGVAVAAGALLGWRAVPAVIAANFLGNLLWGSGLGIAWSFFSSTVHGLIFAGTSAWQADWLRRLSDPTISRAARFIAYAALLILVSACARLFIAHLTLQVSAAYLWRYTLAVAIGNLIGILTVAPLALTLPSLKALQGFLGKLGLVDAAILGLAVLLCYAVFGLKQLDDFKFFYLLFVPIIMLAIRHGLAGAAATILVLDFSIVAILRWMSFEPSTGLDLQLLMISLSATGLILGAAISERERMALQLAQSHERLQESQTALQNAARLSLASEMAAALAHELNQPLAAVRNYVRIVRRKLEQPRLDRRQLAEHVDEAVEKVDHAAGLLKDAREFLSRGEVSKTAIDVASLIDSSMELMKAELGKARVHVTLHLEHGLPKINGNRTQLQQVLLNLMRNAKEAMLASSGHDRRIILSAKHTERPGFVLFSVTDTGPGVPQSVRSAMFSPLRSTKPEGLGLGLSLCRSITINHGGDIWHAEAVASGASFMFTVPVYSQGQGAT